VTAHIAIDHARLAELCRRWGIVELALFGSVLRDDFRADSDVDVLVTFAPGLTRTLFDLVDLQEELEAVFGRRVDLLTRDAVQSSRNPFRRAAILGSAESVYVA
jgi:predicted nucleotidyltransferase